MAQTVVIKRVLMIIMFLQTPPMLLLILLWNKGAAPTPKGRLQWVKLLRAMDLGTIILLTLQRRRATNPQCECNGQVCRLH